MKKILKLTKYVLILGLGIGIARFVLFRDTVATIPVRKVTPAVQEVTKTVSALGKVKSNQEAKVAFSTSGKIASVEVTKGDLINSGQLISVLHSPESEHNIQSARDSRDIALREKDAFVHKYRKESSRDALGGQTQYEIQLRTYDEYISRAEANYQSALASATRNYLYSPFEGKVLDVHKTLGEVVAPGEPVITLAQEERIFEVSVDQADFGLLAEGMSVEIKLDAYPNKKFRGTVTKLPRYANAVTGTSFDVGIEFQDSDENNPILLGMTGDARISVESTNESVTALLYDEVLFDLDGSPYVWVSREGIFYKLPIEIGLEGDLYTEIKTDISEVTIVTPLNGSAQIEEGLKARIQNE